MRPAALLLALLATFAPATGTGLVRGRLRCAGSETMAPLLARLADAFVRRQPAATLQVEGPGSHGALQALLSGTADLAAVSRPLLPAEEQALRKRFGGFVVVRLGTDTLRLLARRGGPAWARPLEAAAAFRTPVPGIRAAGRLPGSGTRHEALGMLGVAVPAPGSIALVSPTALQSALRADPSLVGYGSSVALFSDVVALPGPSLPRPLLLVLPGRNPSPVAAAFLEYVDSPESRGIVRASGFEPWSPVR